MENLKKKKKIWRIENLIYWTKLSWKFAFLANLKKKEKFLFQSVKKKEKKKKG